MTPLNKDRPHSLLAVAWGPYIQIVGMIDHEDRDKPFLVDGFYILKQLNNITQFNQQVDSKVDDEKTVLEQVMGKAELNIEVVNFLSDSTLLVVTSSAEVRVVHTHSFLPNSYQVEVPGNEPLGFRELEALEN